MTKQFNQ